MVDQKRDISSEEDIRMLVDSFYKRILEDGRISYFFTEVAELSWEKHLPIMYQFWSSLIFSTGTYKGNPMIKHIELNKKSKLENEHFDHWISLWHKTVNELFIGSNANIAKEKGKMIMSLMRHKVRQSEDKNYLLTKHTKK